MNNAFRTKLLSETKKFTKTKTPKAKTEPLTQVVFNTQQPVETRFCKLQVLVKLNPEMQEREKRAQKVTAKLRLRVAPLYNKGGYQFISDDTDLTTLGRKV